MRRILFMITACGLCQVATAQSTLDNYFTSGTTFTEVGNQSHGLSAPHDLDYVPGRQMEWWVLNKETNGGSMVLFFDAGYPTQTHQFRRDSHNEHFMARAVAMAFGSNNYFVTAQEIKNTAAPASTFMGPALWSSDTSIYARMHQNNWVTGELLGSHIDMLHQSPYGMGVAHDHDNVYWYFDGHNGNLCKYDFATPHGVGEDDHSDGKIHRYSDVTLTRQPNMPSHMALDKENNWLYIVDGGANRVIRVKTNTGSVGANLSVPSTSAEPLGEYKEVLGATVENLNITGITQACGIDYRKGRIIVSDNTTGNIHMYDVSGSGAVHKGTLITGGPGVMGVRIDNNNKIWYVNKDTKKLMRVDNPNVVGVSNVVKNIEHTIYPNPATNVLNVNINDMDGGDEARIIITDAVGRQVYNATTTSKLNTIDVASWKKGMYMVTILNADAHASSKVMVQ